MKKVYYVFYKRKKNERILYVIFGCFVSFLIVNLSLKNIDNYIE